MSVRKLSGQLFLNPERKEIFMFILCIYLHLLADFVLLLFDAVAFLL